MSAEEQKREPTPLEGEADGAAVDAPPVEEEEVEAALVNMARAQRTSSGALRRDLDKAGRLGELKDQLRREKTVRRLLGEEIDEPDEADDAAAEREEVSATGVGQGMEEADIEPQPESE